VSAALSRLQWQFVPLKDCEVAMFDLILGLAVVVGLFVYLGIALLRPDRF
jgi:K+-transporting ATPase KdpF subunit